uniref:Vacuolar protein sorting-associated protein 62 n=1 Tax=Opuntia streptacantha TaxID=393608 RepID=A0A7C9AUX4_OPUST
MSNCVPVSCPSCVKGVRKKGKALPIDSAFNVPSPLPRWPPGNGFATGTVDLGGLIVAEVTTFDKLWTTYEGGPDNAGASFFEPVGIPEGFSVLGHYAQPNNRALFGWVLVGKDVSDSSNPVLAQPIDYDLVWSSTSSGVREDSPGNIWAPSPPNGYNAVGLIVTTTPDKPPLEKVRCVRSDLTALAEPSELIWSSNDFNIYELRPELRGDQESGVSVGTFVAQIGTGTTSDIACLMNTKADFCYMPNLDQIQTIIQTYSPKIYIHPKEEFHPSSVNWFFSNGALLYKKGDESNPVPIEPDGLNLPQGGSNDGMYWIDLPTDNTARGRVQKGDIESASAYFHLKPMFGGTYTDLVIWLFYPFNGGSRAKVGIFNICLGKIGEHVGDWEHVTLRVSNFNGMLRKAYFSQHSSGAWVHAPNLEFQDGNKFVGYSSLHGHANYPRPGLVLQGTDFIGIRNDTSKSDKAWDTGKGYTIISGEYLGPDVVMEPPWLNYAREWGPKITYDIANEINRVAKFLPGKLRSSFLKIIKSLPNEVLGEEGPTGPRMKDYWHGDER